MAEAVPNRFDDPYWTKVAAQAEARNGLPSGALQAIVLHGERSNNDQVSSAGARTPFQIIPSTRDLFLKKYGVDAYLSPETAAEVAALHIKESLDRGASLPRAVAEYNGGADPAKWDKTVPSYVSRVMGGVTGNRAPTTAAQPKSTFQTVLDERQQPTGQLAQIYDAYKSGKMSATDAAEFEADVNAGKVMLPKGAQLIGKTAPATGNPLPESILKAYKEGKMLRDDMIDLEKDVAGGMWTLPQGEKLGKTDTRSIAGAVGEAITGKERRTPTSEGLQDWAAMPELNQPTIKSALSALGTLTGGPQEIAQIIKAQSPGVKVGQDDKGNILLKSAIDGKEYAIKPGFQFSDIPRLLGGVAAFVPAARATTIAGSALANAGTAAAIEGTQAMAGGNFDPTAVAVAGGVGAAVPAVARAVQAVRNPAQAAIEQAAPAVAAVENPAVFRSNRNPVEQVPARRSTDIAPETTNPATIRTNRPPTTYEWVEGRPVVDMNRRATDAGRTATAPPQAAPAAQPSATTAPKAAAAETAAPTAESMSAEELGKLVQTASGEGMGAVRAQEQIAQAARVNKDALAAAERHGFELPVDFFSDSQLVREAVGLTRSVAGSTASARFREAIEGAAKRGNELMGTLDASPSVAGVSDKVRGSLAATRDDLFNTADKVYKTVNAQVKEAEKAQFPATKKVIAAVKKENPNTMSAQETRLDKLISSKATTYGDLRRTKDQIGDAIAGKQNDFSGMTRGPLKRLYGALADDQLANVERIGGKALADDLREANKLFSQKYALDKRIVNAFGRDNNGSIASVMRNAIEQGSKGDVKALNNLLDIVPKELQKETVASALMSAARAKGGAVRGDFGFSEFNKLYTGLRNNEPVYARIVAALGGKDAHNLLSDLNTVSKRVTDARANVLTTGKANQGLVNSLKAEGLISSVLGKIPGTMAGVATYAAGGRWAGAMLARNTVNALASGKQNVMESAGKMFSSQEFQKIMTEAAVGEPSKETVRKLALSKRFATFANQVNLPRELPARERWIMQAMEAGNEERAKDNK